MTTLAELTPAQAAALRVLADHAEGMYTANVGRVLARGGVIHRGPSRRGNSCLAAAAILNALARRRLVRQVLRPGYFFRRTWFVTKRGRAVVTEG